MAIRIKPVDQLKKKYATNGAAAQGEYAAGVATPRRPQAESAIAAKDTYAAAVTEAIGEDRFAKGVAAAGEDKWKRNAAGKGKDRFPGGVRAAEDDWAKGTAPILAAQASLDAGPRGVKMSEQNFARQRAYAQAASEAAKK